MIDMRTALLACEIVGPNVRHRKVRVGRPNRAWLSAVRERRQLWQISLGYQGGHLRQELRQTLIPGRHTRPASGVVRARGFERKPKSGFAHAMGV
jgi:hypothetical protein